MWRDVSKNGRKLEGGTLKRKWSFELGMACAVLFVGGCEDSTSPSDAGGKTPVAVDPPKVVEPVRRGVAGPDVVYEGETYPTVVVGTQTWFARNLNVTHRTGMSWCFKGVESNCAVHGRLYTWAAATNGQPSSSGDPSGIQGLCPVGWHLPSASEWSNLHSAAVSMGKSGAVLKAASSLWEGIAGVDSLGFAALPSGNYSAKYGWRDFGSAAQFWTTTEGYPNTFTEEPQYYSYALVSEREELTQYNNCARTDGYSIRCVKD